MIHIRELNSKDTIYLEYIQQLIERTFPKSEYRPFEELKLLMENSNKFHVNIITENNEPVGVITYWHLVDFYFIELFAKDESVRNKGYGTLALQTICDKLKGPIILEIELSKTEITKRRQGFYERNHFVTWAVNYFQPPFRSEEKPIPLYLCCYGNLSPQKDFERIKRTIHSKVYKYHE